MQVKNSESQRRIIEKIKKLRTERGISQLAMSDILEISEGLVGSIESIRFPHKYTLKQIYTFCSFIEYPIVAIFLDDEEINSKYVTDKLIEKIIEYDE